MIVVWLVVLSLLGFGVALAVLPPASSRGRRPHPPACSCSRCVDA